MVQSEGGGEARRARRWRSVAEKRRIAELTFEPGASVALVARDHGVNANQVFKWRRELKSGELAEPDAARTALLPVTLSAPCEAANPAQVIQLPAGTKIWIAAGVTDMRRGFDGLSAQVQTVLHEQPFSGHVFIFRGRRGDIVKCLWFDGDGLCLFAKRLERGRFIWPQATEGTVCLSRAQLSMLLEGIDWRRPQRTWAPQIAV